MADKLLYKDLTFKLRGLLFKVHNELGKFKNEKQYGDAVEEELKKLGIKYKRELVVEPSFAGEKKGRNIVDFLIDNKVILELKHVPFLNKDHYYQCQRYLAALKLDLALLWIHRDTTPIRVWRESTRAKARASRARTKSFARIPRA